MLGKNNNYAFVAVGVDTRALIGSSFYWLKVHACDPFRERSLWKLLPHQTFSLPLSRGRGSCTQWLVYMGYKCLVSWLGFEMTLKSQSSLWDPLGPLEIASQFNFTFLSVLLPSLFRHCSPVNLPHSNLYHGVGFREPE